MIQKDNKDLVKDPVCNMVKSVEEMKAKVEYKGKTYYFCTEQDKEMFEAYPEHWIPKQAGGEEKQ